MMIRWFWEDWSKMVIYLCWLYLINGGRIKIMENCRLSWGDVCRGLRFREKGIRRRIVRRVVYVIKGYILSNLIRILIIVQRDVVLKKNKRRRRLSLLILPCWEIKSRKVKVTDQLLKDCLKIVIKRINFLPAR